MAERIVSPGVFTQERDLSFLEQGVGEIAGAFIGPTAKGPAFIPTTVTSQQDFENKFGVSDGKSFLGQTVKNYLTQTGRATVVRVLGLDGYSNTNHTPAIITATGSNGSFIYAILHPTISGSKLEQVSASGAITNFDLVLSSSAVADIALTGLSTTTSAGGYLGNALGFGPAGINNGYIYGIFPEAITMAGAAASVTMSAATSSNALFLTGSTYGLYSNASTPWIQSQTLGGIKQNLFKLHTLTDGTAANKAVKISIIGPKKASIQGDYATFTLLVRDFNDTDTRPNILQQWDGLNLNPNSPNYIARVIGNSAPVENASGERYFEGFYPNTNSWVRVEMAPGVETISPDAVPFGFAALNAPIGTLISQLPTPTYISSSWISASVRTGGYNAQATYNVSEFYGYAYSDTMNTNMSYLAPIPSGSTTRGAAFNLENLSNTELYDNSGNAVTVSNFLTNQDIADQLRFTVPLQGGFDGDNPARTINMYESISATNTQGFNLSNATTAGSRAYKKALDALSNPESVDMNLLILPGVVYELHSYVADYARNICEARGDCFYIMDLTQASATVTSAVNQAALLDTNYAAAYYPWVKVRDTNSGQYAFVPPSVVLPEVYAYSDNQSAEWFAPAGLNRGGILGAAGVKVKLTQAQRDQLYEGKVNPIVQFTGQGVCVWGQKTLQRRASALDRVNVRRLLISVKKFVASSSRFLVFEQNVESTRRRFLNIVNPFLANIQERSGLYSFRVIMDESNNTPDVIDRNILVGSLYLQPTKTAEFIKLDFNILPTGATFTG